MALNALVNTHSASDLASGVTILISAPMFMAGILFLGITLLIFLNCTPAGLAMCLWDCGRLRASRPIARLLPAVVLAIPTPILWAVRLPAAVGEMDLHERPWLLLLGCLAAMTTMLLYPTRLRRRLARQVLRARDCELAHSHI